MLMNLKDLAKTHEMKVKGVVHLGAHTGEEAEIYRQLKWEPVFWVEADPNVMPKLQHHIANYRNHVAIRAVVTETDDEWVEFYIANNEESSSILRLQEHAVEHPEVIYVNQMTMRSRSLDVLAEEHGFEGCNFLNMDIQGAELQALKGGLNFLEGVDYIYSEVNRKPLYEDCAIITQMNKFLKNRNFELKELTWTRHGWGDALYIKEKK